jgi:hypothetical protein
MEAQDDLAEIREWESRSPLSPYCQRIYSKATVSGEVPEARKLERDLSQPWIALAGPRPYLYIGFPWHSYGTPAASRPHQVARLPLRKWLSQQVACGVEQRINWAFNPLVDGSIPSRPTLIFL